MRPTVAITTGEPAGIGPEISLRAAWEVRHQLMPVLLGDARWLRAVSEKVNPAITLQVVAPEALSALRDRLDVLAVVDCPLAHDALSGQLDPSNSPAVLRTLDVAVAGAQQRWFDAIVTAPLQKSTINDAGIAFTGHTEYLAEKTNTPQVVMMLTGSVSDEGTSFPLRVALATTHLPLREVADAITTASLTGTLEIIDRDLKRWFGIPAPRILVAGLNPHAGEGGYLGREEIEVIEPVIDTLRKKGVDVRGPYPADTLFQPALLRQADCVLAMYHDQGLPVLKHASFGSAVNVTLGLPIIRTSVDHGTALDQAKKGVGHAHHRSMIEAMLLAAHMAAHK